MCVRESLGWIPGYMCHREFGPETSIYVSERVWACDQVICVRESSGLGQVYVLQREYGPEICLYMSERV